MLPQVSCVHGSISENAYTCHNLALHTAHKLKSTASEDVRLGIKPLHRKQEEMEVGPLKEEDFLPTTLADKGSRALICKEITCSPSHN